MKQDVGRRVKELRTTLKLTQEQFALPLGVDRGHIAGIETGSRNPSEPLVKIIHFIYCVNETWLKSGEGEMLITSEAALKNQIARFGERAIVETLNKILKESGQDNYTVTAESTGDALGAMKSAVARFGEQAVLEAFQEMIKEHGLAMAAGRTNHQPGTGDPELDRIIAYLTDLWSSEDDRIKAWAAVQFERAFPDIKDFTKKQKGPVEHTSAG